jgi:hypothetical protein
MRQRAPRFGLALACGLLAPVAWAQGAVLDFEDLTCARSQESCEVGDQYMAKGFALRYVPGVDEPMAAGLTAVGPAAKPNKKGSVALSIRSCGAQASLMANDNSSFGVASIELAEMNSEGPVSVAFVGLRDDGAEVRQTMKLDGKPGWQKFSFGAGFRKLASLQWTQGDCLSVQPHMVDNIELLTPVGKP